jgi:DNA-binding beta-propeller fold protein YncE
VNSSSSSVTAIYGDGEGKKRKIYATGAGVAYPYDVVVNPVTNQIYVGSGDVSAVTVIDGATHNTFDIPGVWQPAYLAINTRTNKIYAAGAQSNGGIMVIDGATGTSTQLSTPVNPYGFNSLIQVVVNEVTNKVYVVDSMSRNLLVVDGTTNEITFRTLEFNPNLVAVNPANNRVYVSHLGEGLISIISE